jgi:serine/threonine protein kinase
MALIFGRDASFLSESIDNYYQYNPDTLMPLLMLSLAAQGKLSIKNDARNGSSFARLDIDQVMDYDWVKLNPVLKKELKEQKANGAKIICAVGKIPTDLKDIYETFYQYDTVTVVQEYHHRRGILVHHSSNAASESAQRQYATLCLAGELAAAPQDWLHDQFLYIANDILVKSGIQPKRPRIRVAQALDALLDYDGEGVVYNPFAGCAFAAALVGGGKNLYIDGDTNDKLLAVSRLLCYGTGQKGCHVEQRDSTQWRKDITPDYVLSTYLGYPSGISAFDTCLAFCLKDCHFTGKFAGIAAPKDIFENQSGEMKEALRRDWVDTIVLLSFGEVAVLIDAAKPADRKNRVRFYNLTHPMLSRRPVYLVIGEDIYADILKLSDVKKKGFLKSLLVPVIDQEEGCEIITLGDICEKMPRRTWSLARVREEARVLARIDTSTPYDEWQRVWMQGIEKEEIVSLFAPAYKLDCACLIVNRSGSLEPRFFDADLGNAFFQDGLAFRFKSLDLNFDWLVHELCKPYVRRQLYPYGMDEMVPDCFTEDQILSLKLNCPKASVADCEKNPDDDKLPSGQVLHGDKTEYTIHRFLGHGFFGYTYSANSHNLVTGEDKEVVLKEFYPYNYFHREGIKAVLDDPDCEDFKEENCGKFIEEAQIMHKLGMTPDSHIVPAYEQFHSNDTDTDYYVMPFYKDGSLDDLQDSGFSFSEDMLIHHVVIPMCKALNIAHKNKVLHLDIKPENILVDENGDAVLIDFGVAKQYDERNSIINCEGLTASGIFAAPELKRSGMIKFGPQPDIYGLAATLFYLATDRDTPHPIMDFGEEDEDIRISLDFAGFSKQFSDAIVAGLEFLNRPRNAQEFLNLFPGCENIKL